MNDNWISVEDNGNPTGRNQWGSSWWIVKRKGNIPMRGLFVADTWSVYKRIDHLEDHFGCFQLETVFDVTHWQPLPESPKEK